MKFGKICNRFVKLQLRTRKSSIGSLDGIALRRSATVPKNGFSWRSQFLEFNSFDFDFLRKSFSSRR